MLDYGVFIGRFQPFHNGHLHILRFILSRAHRAVVAIGSSNGPRTIKNPFTFEERRAMILGSLNFSEKARISFVASEDAAYNDTAWASEVSQRVLEITQDRLRVGLFGHTKDESSFYLKMFPQWQFVEVGNFDGVNATEIRDDYFRRDWDGLIPMDMPNGVLDFLENFSETPEYSALCAERKYIDDYKASWASAPYPPVFMCVDACVVQQGHVLLIERKDEPGKGLWALPGGFIGQRERLEDAMIRELREETCLKVPEPVLRGHIVRSQIFDAPDRSMRGRTITNAYLIHLPPHGEGFPKVKGSDDAKAAKWWPLGDVKIGMMFDDHYSMIRNLTAAL